MKKQKRLNKQRIIRKYRVSNAVKEHSTRPRLCVFRSAKHIYAQLICDVERKTLASASTMDKEFKALGKYGGNVEAAAIIGEMVAKRALAAGVTQAAFDRGGSKYHGRVKALAEAARAGGLDLGAAAVVEEAKPVKAEPKQKKAKSK
ncbi:MAG: 50S ribosomal protein L18 [Thermoguttaceae bacterium]|nr:50S ribosomal protein L18 [Thermoguttaceae bacterium]